MNSDFTLSAVCNVHMVVDINMYVDAQPLSIPSGPASNMYMDNVCTVHVHGPDTHSFCTSNTP